MLKIVLASQSPRRKNLLNQLGIAFEIIPSTVTEIITSTNPFEIVTDLSLQKAKDVASTQSDSLVIGADTIVVQNGTILGKPNSKEEAFTMLTNLSGTFHYVYTGVSFVVTDASKNIYTTLSFYEETKVWFTSLSEHEIQSYINGGSPMDKAGAYGIQDDWGSVFVERIEGDYYNVVGLPLSRFYKEIKTIIPTIFDTLNIPNSIS